MADNTERFDINTVLMQSTFRIAGRLNLGTAFILGRPIAGSTKSGYVLVTAAHVLDDIKDDEATLFLRIQPSAGVFMKLPFTLQIRKQGSPLWQRHVSADVAAMPVRLPQVADLRLASTELLATDTDLSHYEIHPGDALSCLGYPYGAEANDAGFPILRSGRISSFPLTPTSLYPTFLFDFRIFGGNSGGPVYLAETSRTYGGQTHLGRTLQFIIGIVIQEKIIEEEITSLTETRRTKHQLGLAVVVAAPLVQQTIDLLPPATDD